MALAMFGPAPHATGAAEQDGTAAPATPPATPLSVAYLDWQGGWHLLSLFPMLEQQFLAHEVHVGYVRPRVEDPHALWEQLRPFHVLLTSDLPAEGPAAEVFRRFGQAGGGLFLVNSRWTTPRLEQTFPGLGLRSAPGVWSAAASALTSLRGVQDPETATGEYWWSRRIATHPCTAAVNGLAFPKMGDYDAVATQHLECSEDWQVLVRAQPTARVFDLVREHTSGFPVWKDTGIDGAEPPLFLVRTLGQGRIAMLPVGAEFVVWNLGNPGFPQVFMELGDGAAQRSDGWTLMLNTLRWLAEPALAAGTGLGGFRAAMTPVRPEYPAAVPVPAPPPRAPAVPRYRGLAGVHADLSDGKASVAEYAAAARRLGLAFLLFADPAEMLTDEKYAELRRQCEATSDESFHAVPGIQYGDVSGIRWACFRPHFLPGAPYLEKDGRRVLKDGLYAYNSSGDQFALARMPLQPSRIAPDPRNLWWHHFLAPWEYDGQGRLACENADTYLALVGNGIGLVPTAYGEIRTVQELENAARQCAMVLHGESLAQSLALILPAEKPPYLPYSADFMYVTQGPHIDQFSLAHWNFAGGRVEFTRGLQYCSIRVGASSAVGLREVALLDGSSGVYRRFLPQGAKEFTRAWTGVHDRQRFLVVRATDTQGRTAYSSPHVLFNNARGLYFCGDNQNSLLNQNTPFYHPGRHEFPGAPPNWVPSFYGWRGWDGMANRVRQAYIMAPHFSPSFDGESDLEPGCHYERPLEVVLAGYFCNVFKVRTSRMVGPFTDEAVSGSATLPPRGDTRVTEQEYTSTIPASRAHLDCFWFRPQWLAHAIEQYQASVSLLEGRVRFRKAVDLAGVSQPAPVASMSAWGLGLPSFYVCEPGQAVREVRPEAGGLSGVLVPGALVTAGPLPGSPFLANAGPGPMRFEMTADSRPASAGFGACTLGIGEPGQHLDAGTGLDFRVVTGFLKDGLEPGRTGSDLARSLNLDGQCAGYPLQVTLGTLADATFFLTLEAADSEAAFRAGPRKMYLDLPVRVRGLADNGCAAFLEKRIGHLVFVPVVGGQALFQVAIDEGVELWAGNLFVCDHAEVRLTVVGADEGDPTLELHNPTAAPLRVEVRSPTHAPLFGGWRHEAELPAGDSVFVRPERTALVGPR